MFEYKIVGGEYFDAMVEDSFTTFDYSLFAVDREDAMEKFHTIFPGCVCMSVGAEFFSEV